MPRVLAITNNLKQASCRLRLLALQQPLAERGVQLDVQVRPRAFFARRRLLKSAVNYDAVLLQRKMLNPLDARLLRKSASHVFFDVDDAVMYHPYPVGPLERWRTWKRFISTAKTVDRVIAGNGYLADLFQQQGAATTILPTVVDPNRYQQKTHAATSSPALVWIGTSSTLIYLRQLAPMLTAAAALVPGLRLIVIADKPWLDCPIPAEHRPWSADTEAASLIAGDIGIAPTPTDRWTLGKCGFKIVQYMAAGLPVIADPVGANAEIILENQTGLLPLFPNDWPAAIAKLAANLQLRQSFGQAGRARVETEYSIKKAADFWADLINSIA